MRIAIALIITLALTTTVQAQEKEFSFNDISWDLSPAQLMARLKADDLFQNVQYQTDVNDDRFEHSVASLFRGLRMRLQDDFEELNGMVEETGTVVYEIYCNIDHPLLTRVRFYIGKDTGKLVCCKVDGRKIECDGTFIECQFVQSILEKYGKPAAAWIAPEDSIATQDLMKWDNGKQMLIITNWRFLQINYYSIENIRAVGDVGKAKRIEELKEKDQKAEGMGDLF